MDVPQLVKLDVIKIVLEKVVVQFVELNQLVLASQIVDYRV